MALPIRIDDIKEKAARYISPDDLLLIDKAYALAYSAHKKQLRKDGTYYIVHPLFVAFILAGIRMDAVTIAAGLLHDVLEDTEVTEESLFRYISELDDNEKSCEYVDLEELKKKREEQAREIVTLVKGVSYLPNAKTEDYIHKRTIKVRDVLIAAKEDPRVVFIKLADRLHNMRTLQYMSERKQRIIAEETLNIFAPLAHLYGLYHIRNELEDLSFKFLDPENYNKLQNVLREYKAERMPIMEQAKAILREELKKANVKAEVTSRIKHLYGIYNKLLRRGINIENARDVHDIIGLRIIVDNENDIYNAYSVVSRLWKVIDTKDYVSNPKPNGYRSYHIIVMGPNGKKMEIQIRTWEMHEFAEFGVAAHWFYKLRTQRISKEELEKVNRIRKIIVEAIDEQDTPAIFRSRIEEELKKYKDFIRVFTPKGDQIILPPGSTPIDFAYAIHSYVGDHCRGAKVDGAIKPLNYRLKDGETVEILTDPNKKPSYEWLSFARTSKARNRIRRALFREDSRDYIEIGRSILRSVLKANEIGYKKFIGSEEFKRFLEREKIENEETFLLLIGRSNIKEAHLKKIIDEILKKTPARKQSVKKSPRSSNKVVIHGFESLPYRFCKTCNPHPGDLIVGYISRSRRVITVHRFDCPDLKKLDPRGLILTHWEKEKDSDKIEVRLMIEVEDRPGVLREISTLTEMRGINIRALTFNARGEGRSIGILVLETPDLQTAKTIIDEIGELESVSHVKDSTIG